MDTIVIAVRGMPVVCYRCRAESGAVVALHPVDDLDFDGGCWHADEPVLALARELLAAAGEHQIAAPIRERFSRMDRRSYLSNGCHHCSAIFGRYYLTSDLTGTAISATQSFADFTELTRGRVDIGRWWCLIEDRSMVLG